MVKWQEYFSVTLLPFPFADFGLGLAIAQQIVQSHGSEISFKRVVQEGTILQNYLP
ncbi:MAG: ATP-binding protein [Nostoc sp.]|uniref:ATP-binding protein n=1 Tax=Nostoc sp. TaxID=1180 RepID=UPI002FFC8039